MTCLCGHVRHINGRGLCLADGCRCLIFRPLNKRQQPTAQGVRAPGGGTSLPQQAQNEGTP